MNHCLLAPAFKPDSAGST